MHARRRGTLPNAQVRKTPVRYEPESVPKPVVPKPVVRCAVYTRKSTDEGLAQEFNSLDAQREAAEAYISSQRHEGWALVSTGYDDGGFSGANMDRPALRRLLADIDAGKIDCVVVYKLDRLSRSLLDFVRIMEAFEKRGVSFVSVTQQFNTNASLGRLLLNILLSFAQFEREMIAERTRDKMSAARRRGKWVGGIPVLGYDVDPRGGKLAVNETEAEQVRAIFNLYREYRSLIPVVRELNQRGWTTKSWATKEGREHRGQSFTKNALYRLLTNVIYVGQVNHKGYLFTGLTTSEISPFKISLDK
jgi:site-specific DNA recombinase